MHDPAPRQKLQVPGMKEKKVQKVKQGNKVLTKADISGPQDFKYIGEIQTYNLLHLLIYVIEFEIWRLNGGWVIIDLISWIFGK